MKTANTTTKTNFKSETNRLPVSERRTNLIWVICSQKTTTKQRLTYAEGRSLTFSWRIASNFWYYYLVFPRLATTSKNAKTFYKCWCLLVQSLVFAGPLVAEKSDTDNQTPRGKFMTMNRPCWYRSNEETKFQSNRVAKETRKCPRNELLINK